MKEKIWIGVDGGGTKTAIRIEDDAGKVLGRTMVGPSNIRLSPSLAWQMINDGIAKILADHSITLMNPNIQFHLCMGLAGGEVASAREAFLAHIPHFIRFTLVSDAHIACYGAHLGQDGAVIVVGTGVIGYQIEAGHATRISGWGFPHDDEGGGAWLGWQAVRHTLRVFDFRQKETQLSQAIYASFADNFSKLIEFANSANASEYAGLAPLVISAAPKCMKAASLLKHAAQSIYQIRQALYRTQSVQKSPLPCAILGGIAPFLQTYFTKGLQDKAVIAKVSPEEGAILWAKACMIRKLP